jgi:hypothetical protein
VRLANIAGLLLAQHAEQSSFFWCSGGAYSSCCLVHAFDVSIEQQELLLPASQEVAAACVLP